MPTRTSALKLNVYRIDNCCFTERGKDDVVVDALATGFRSAAEWVAGRARLQATRTELRAGDEDDPIEVDKEPLLCRAVESVAGDYLFAMFQVLSGAKGSVSSLALDARVNVDRPKRVNTRGRITGVSRYIWVLPQEGLLCSVRLDSSATSVPAFASWMKGYLQHWWQGVDRYQRDVDAETKEKWVIQKGADPLGRPPHLWAKVSCTEPDDVAALERVLQGASTIRAVLFKGSINTQSVRADVHPLFRPLANLIPRAAFQGGQVVQARILVKEPTPGGLTRPIVEGLRSVWFEEREQLDVGFELDRGIVWFSRPKPLKDSVVLSFSGDNDEEVDVATFLRTLRRQFRDRVLRSREAEG